ncbi:3-hydroxyacyl-CoA dehydrogenase family protein [Chloroflexota bacterium]
MNIRKICVIGAGTMGNGIAQVAAQAKYETSMVDIKEDILNRGMDTIKSSLSRLVKKGALKPEDVEEVLKRIHTSTSIGEASRDADFVIEAALEKPEVKMSIFRQLDALCPEVTILGSTTTTIPIALLSSATKRADKVIGTHFFNPVPVMRGAEVVRALSTSEQTVQISLNLLQSFGKETVVVKDYPGFVSSRLLLIVLNEGAKVLEEGLGSLEDIDKIMKLSLNWPRGPLELADIVGLDVVVDSMESIYRETGWERYKPAPLLKRMVEIGYLGSKTGKGLYTLFRKSPESTAPEFLSVLP